MNKHTADFNRELRDRTEEARNDPRSTAALLRLAVNDVEGDEGASALSTLHYRATREVLRAVTPLCRSTKPQERMTAAHVLGQLGIPDRAFPDECLALLAGMLSRESDPEVLHSVCVACGHLDHPAAVPLLVSLAGHSSSLVRDGVVSGLSGREDPESVAALINLSGDPNANVRDWATFGLGSQIDLDTPEIRDTLAARLNDPDGPTRGEALVGLANRRDERVLPSLIEALAEDDERFGGRFDLVLQAAEELADHRLLPALLALRERGCDEAALEDTIEACSSPRPDSAS